MLHPKLCNHHSLMGSLVDSQTLMYSAENPWAWDFSFSMESKTSLYIGGSLLRYLRRISIKYLTSSYFWNPYFYSCLTWSWIIWWLAKIWKRWKFFKCWNLLLRHSTFQPFTYIYLPLRKGCFITTLRKKQKLWSMLGIKWVCKCGFMWVCIYFKIREVLPGRERGG